MTDPTNWGLCMIFVDKKQGWDFNRSFYYTEKMPSAPRVFCTFSYIVGRA